jgi:predicted nucleotidyltransferase
VTHLAVFGWVARGDVGEAGDLDILIKLDQRY